MNMVQFFAVLAILLAVVFNGCSGGSSGSSNSGGGGTPARSSTFVFQSRAVATCPQASSWCTSNWPPSSEGTVYLYSFRETRVATGQQITRTAYVYKPLRVTGISPALIFLHGGTGTGENNFSSTVFAEMADSRSDSGQGWRRNTLNCRFKQDASGYERPAGGACTPVVPPQVTFANTKGFFVIYPNGVLDEGSSSDRHWEDGRVPSPGFSTTTENRDDVGFINALIGALKTQEAGLVDNTRIYVGGVSNGGMMTLRLACNVGRTGLSELSSVAAFAAVVATLPTPLMNGTQGRESCGAGGVFPLAWFVGYDVPTPNCSTFGCSSPTVSGDGRMPYGVSGGTYTVNSPDLGTVSAFPDAEDKLKSLLTAAGAGTATVSSTNVGYYTTSRNYNFLSTDARLQIFETQWGNHTTMSTRMDFNPSARIWEFVSSFQRTSSGVIIETTPSHLSGTY